MVRRFRGVIAATLMALVAGVLIVPASVSAQVVPPTKPNVVLIVVDDMRWDEAGLPTALNETFPSNYLPNIRAMAAQGFYATNSFVVNSLCCPSRASILTGNYAHTTKVWNNQNNPLRGGFKAWQAAGNENSNLATWFDAAGYRTALVGKYFNGYNSALHQPQGWDRWVAYLASTINHYNYTLTIDKVTRAFGSAPADYATDVFSGYATDFIRTTDDAAPLFLYFTPYSPHSPFTAAPRHNNMFQSYTPAMPPDLGEADVSDKPAWVRAQAVKGKGWKNTKRDQMEMLMSVDDAVGAIRATLAAEGRLDNTVFMFTSDNGLSGGSHRWTTKKSPWDEALRTPFIAMGPGITPGTTSNQLILNVDIADTLGELAGVPIPATEGASVVPLLAGGTAPVHAEFQFDHLYDGNNPPSYCGVRTLTHKYIRYSTGEEELYDLTIDPWELTSKHADPAYATIKAQLKARAIALCSPPPPGYSF